MRPHAAGGATWTTFPGIETFQEFMLQVPRVMIDFHHYECLYALEDARQMFKYLAGLAEKRSLKTITLLGLPHEKENHDRATMMSVIFPLFYRIHALEGHTRMLEVLREANAQDRAISKVERKILLGFY